MLLQQAAVQIDQVRHEIKYVKHPWPYAIERSNTYVLDHRDRPVICLMDASDSQDSSKMPEENDIVHVEVMSVPSEVAVASVGRAWGQILST